jgi:hypothetical protein
MIMCDITLDAGQMDMDGTTVDGTHPNLVCKLGAPIGDVNPDNNHLLLPQAFAGPVCFNIYLTNPKGIDLCVTSITVRLNGGQAAPQELLDCIAASLPINVNAGATEVISCSLNFDTCRDEFDGAVSVKAVAKPGNLAPCIYNVCGHAATTTTATPCTFNIDCEQEVACRTTGGGTLYPGFIDRALGRDCVDAVTEIFPLLGVDHISHGGQLGAPFSQMDCGAILGNPCIRGQWEHVRHYQGNGNPRDVIDMNFHSTTPKGVFDSLFCACLGCCDPVTGAFIPPEIGPLVHKFQICNPDDHKVCGPQPRPAPANALIFSGVGRITPEDDVGGPRANRSEWVVFRVLIIDRSEPGGGHPDPSFPTEPADIYCFQAWKTTIKTSRKPDFTTIWTGFRMALGEDNCEFLKRLEAYPASYTRPDGTVLPPLPPGSLPSSTILNKAADIRDCGPLHDGNRQIHPATGADCNQ